MNRTKNNYLSIIQPMKNLDDALLVIKECFWFFIGIGILQSLIGLFLMPILISDGLIYIILGMLLKFLKSRLAAISLLLFSSVSLVVTILNRIGIIDIGGGNVFLAVVMIFIAIQAVRASFYYHKVSPQKM